MTSFRSSERYSAERMHAAAVYCSDGRVGEPFDDFLQNGLGLPRYDRVALPGGPACLAGYGEARVAQEGVADELKFLIEAHELSRVVLIQHEGCAFYAMRLGIDAGEMEGRQRADLRRAAAIVRQVTGLERVEGYYARVDGGEVVFEPVAVD